MNGSFQSKFSAHKPPYATEGIGPDKANHAKHQRLLLWGKTILESMGLNYGKQDGICAEIGEGQNCGLSLESLLGRTVQPSYALSHIVKGHISVHVSGGRRAGVAQLLLHLAKVACFLQEVDRNSNLPPIYVPT